MSDSSEKTENATPQKLREARKRGQVPRGNDIPATLTLLFATLYLWLSWDSMVESFKAMLLVTPQLLGKDFHQTLPAAIETILVDALFTWAIPFSMFLVIAGILGNILQFGFLFSLDPIMPKPEKINPAEGAKRIFSMRQVVQTLLSLAKTLIVGLVLLIVLRMGMKELLHAIEQCHVACQQDITEYMLGRLILYLLPVLIALAVLDYLFQRAQFMKQQRMTKEEIKREFKEQFGDPHVRGARQGIRREMAEQDIQKRIRTSRLLVLDMGLAVAIHYEQDKTPLPIIVAIGKGNMARKMAEIAQKEHVPIVSDPTLAQKLADEGKIDQYIPESTIPKIADALRKTAKSP